MAHNPIKALLAIAALFCAMDLRAEAPHPHSITNTMAADCTACHINQPEFKTTGPLETKNKTVNLAEFKNDGVGMCSSCHDPADGHKIGLKLDFDVPADLVLDNKKALSCLTCHYTHGKLTSETPQASYSVMDKLMDAPRLHKSFLLRRNNVDGELCLICHNPDQGKK